VIAVDQYRAKKARLNRSTSRSTSHPCRPWSMRSTTSAGSRRSQRASLLWARS